MPELPGPVRRAAAALVLRPGSSSTTALAGEPELLRQLQGLVPRLVPEGLPEERAQRLICSFCLRLVHQHVLRCAKRIYGVPELRFYGVANGVKQLLFSSHRGLGPANAPARLPDPLATLRLLRKLVKVLGKVP